MMASESESCKLEGFNLELLTAITDETMRIDSLTFKKERCDQVRSFKELNSKQVFRTNLACYKLKFNFRSALLKDFLVFTTICVSNRFFRFEFVKKAILFSSIIFSNC